MGRGQFNHGSSIVKSRNVLLGKKSSGINSVNVEDLEAICKTGFFFCNLCRRSIKNNWNELNNWHTCSCKNPSPILSENQIPNEILTEIYSIQRIKKNYRFGHIYSDGLIIPAGSRIAFDTSTSEYVGGDRQVFTKRKQKTTSFYFEEGMHIDKSKKIEQLKTVLYWKTGDKRKGVFVDELDLKASGITNQWKSYLEKKPYHKNHRLQVFLNNCRNPQLNSET